MLIFFPLIRTETKRKLSRYKITYNQTITVIQCVASTPSLIATFFCTSMKARNRKKKKFKKEIKEHSIVKLVSLESILRDSGAMF